MEDFRRLEAYRLAKALARDIYQVTARLPLYLRWRLGGQLDDAAESVGANIAEGCGRKNAEHGNVELIRYLHMSFGSACEVEHRIGGLADRGLISPAECTDLLTKVEAVKKKVASLIVALKRGDRGRTGQYTDKPTSSEADKQRS
ncbi:MAG TPA: four helix bundle protein [Gemmatimonadaceae bacterium]|nr:four helix bundle protein [Gemmatimonadaceae bacterium]